MAYAPYEDPLKKMTPLPARPNMPGAPAPGLQAPPQAQTQTVTSPQMPPPQPQQSPGQLPPGGMPQAPTSLPSAGPVNAQNVAQYAHDNIDSSINMNEWNSYQQYFDPSCPPGTPYKSRKTGPNGQPIGGCQEKPDNCPEGMIAYGQTQCVPTSDPRVAASVQAGQGGGGAGGAGGGSMSGKINYGGVGVNSPYSQKVWKSIMDRLNGESRYSPEVVSALQGQIKMQAEQGKTQQTDEALANMASRGMARSGNQNAVFRDINARASGQVLGAQNDIAKAKIDADFQDKSAALQSAQQWLDSMRQYTATMTGTQAQKEAAMANISLGYARLKQEMDMMREQYAMGMNSTMFGGGF